MPTQPIRISFQVNMSCFLFHWPSCKAIRCWMVKITLVIDRNMALLGVVHYNSMNL